jgi:hypothetical protein
VWLQWAMKKVLFERALYRLLRSLRRGFSRHPERLAGMTGGHVYQSQTGT